ncbi:hypothetical protein [Pseudomonas graminis]
MLIDASQFPLVWIQFDAPDRDPDAPLFSGFEALLARQQAFVILNDEGLPQGRREQPAEEMKQITRWMKAYKNELQAFVKAAIHIEPDESKRLAATHFTLFYEKFWGYPMLLTASREEALIMAATCLTPAQTDQV